MILQLKFQHTLEDILELNRTAREQRLKAWFISAFGVVLLLWGGWFAAFGDPERSAAPIFVSGGFFLLIGLFATRLAGYGAWRLKASRAPYELELTSSGVKFLESDGPQNVPWEDFPRWYLTPNLLVLVGRADALAIPKRSCPESAWCEVLDLVRNYVGEASLW